MRQSEVDTDYKLADAKCSEWWVNGEPQSILIQGDETIELTSRNIPQLEYLIKRLKEIEASAS